MPSPTEIERASYASWPAWEQVDYGGWILRFADGYTKRANSVNPLIPGIGDLDEAVSHCQSFYNARKQPTIFRLLSFVNDNDKLDSYLAEAGYRLIDPTLVLYRSLEDTPPSPNEGISNIDRKVWLDNYVDISGSDPSRRAVHGSILERVPASSLFAVQEYQGQTVACGLAVIYQGIFGMFDIVTAKEVRQLGHGGRLVQNLLSWAGANGAQHAYVQVMANNAPAIRLYEKLGYRRVYHYWYRVGKV